MKDSARKFEILFYYSRIIVLPKLFIDFAEIFYRIPVAKIFLNTI